MGGGLYLEITPSGSKLWRLKYRFANKARLLSLGKFPDVSLEQARQGRDDVRKLVAAGTTPLDVRKEQKQVQAEHNANTFEKIAREWHANRLETWQPNTARDILHRFEKDIFPEIGALPVREITHKPLIDALRKIESRGAHEIAKRLKAAP